MKWKMVMAMCLLISPSAPDLFAQDKNKVKANWQNLDLKMDNVFGMSTERAYEELLKTKQPKKIIVAVIDGGVDIEHEDLKQVIWKNQREVPENNKDDDGNGYIDDVHGWNFLGSSKESFEFDNDDLTKRVRNYRAQFAGKDSTNLTGKNRDEFKKFKADEMELEENLKKAKDAVANSKAFFGDLDVVMKKIGKEHPSRDDFKNFVPSNAQEERLQRFVVALMENQPDLSAYLHNAHEQLKENEKKVNYFLNLDYDPRGKYADEYLSRGRFYGNNNATGPVPPEHGTHVAGILGAVRHNGLGIDGVAANVLIMPIRAIPDGDARDVDEANAIRYAAENGAKVINMSFGLSTGTNREAVEAAVRYALSKGVLFIQASGNGGDNLDPGKGYPDRTQNDTTGFTDAFIKVSASGFSDDKDLVPRFSNYGSKAVDVFAPGVEINSTQPGNRYEVHSGTSMAAPMVSGLAAIIMGYYPKLSAKQVKEIIMQSVVKREVLKDKCISGGVVNAYDAIKLASAY